MSVLWCTLLDKNSSDKIVEISAWCRKFCPTKNFVQYFNTKVGNIRQNCRNFGLVSKILHDEIFYPSKILSDKVCHVTLLFRSRCLKLMFTDFVHPKFYQFISGTLDTTRTSFLTIGTPTTSSCSHTGWCLLSSSTGP